MRIVTLDRAEVRNAVDGEHAQALYDAFAAFDADESASVAVLHGANGVFCSGADLGAVSRREMPLPGPPGCSTGACPLGASVTSPVVCGVSPGAVGVTWS